MAKTEEENEDIFLEFGSSRGLGSLKKTGEAAKDGI